MALLVALIAVLVLAVVIVLGVFAWVLLAPLVRQHRDTERRGRDDEESGRTVLFGRPMARGQRDRRDVRASTPVATTVAVPAAAREPEVPVAVPVAVVEPEPELPSASVVEPAPPPTPAVAVPAALEPPPPVADVLVVTADHELSDCQVAILAARGCASRCVMSASDAIGQLRARIPDLVLLDTGGASEAVPLVAALRAWRATEFLPVVLFTPNPDADVCRSAAALGVTDVVVDAPSVPGLVERALPYWLAGVGVFSSIPG